MARHLHVWLCRNLSPHFKTDHKTMTNTTNIQTVHGVTHPIVAGPPLIGDDDDTSIERYREETAKRLKRSIEAARAEQSSDSSKD